MIFFFVDEAQIDDLIDLFAEDFTWEVGFDQMTSFTSKPKLSAFLKKFNGAAIMMRHLPVTPCIEVDCDSDFEGRRFLHEIGTWGLIGFLAVHIAAALHHQFILKDGVLRRMWFGDSKPKASE